jgi:hypothetical protein
MLRVIVGLLLLANLLFFGWARGWFEPSMPPPHHGEREPQRLAAQVRPDAVIVLAPKAASAAIAAARAAAAVCLQAGPLSEAEMGAAEAALAPVQLPDGAVQREPAPPPPLWLVLAARSSDAAQRRAREAELEKLGLRFERLEAPPELALGLLLSRHRTKAEAEAAVAALAAASQPLRGARVANLPAPPPRLWLRVPRADVDQQARLLALPPAAVAATGGGFKPCAVAS